MRPEKHPTHQLPPRNLMALIGHGIALLFFSLISQTSLSQQSSHSYVESELNELSVVAKMLSRNTNKPSPSKDTRTLKLFEQVYRRGVSVTIRVAEMDQKGDLNQEKRAEYLSRLQEIKLISQVHFYEVSDGKIKPDTKDFHLRAIEFFSQHNPRIDKNLFDTFLQERGGFTNKYGMNANFDLSAIEYKTTYRTRLINGVKMFAEQLFSLSMAQLLLSTGSSTSMSNPVSVQQNWHAIKDPYVMASFGGFIATHQQVKKTLSKATQLSPSLINFIGMVPAMLVSATLHELFIDTDLRTCYFSDTQMEKAIKSNNQIDEGEKKKQLQGLQEIQDQSCYRAGRRWLSKDKYIAYTPELTSLILAAAGSHTISSGLIKGSVKIMPKKMAVKFLTALRGASFFTPLGIAFNVGNFVIFLYLNEEISPIIHTLWDPFNFNHLGWHISEELKENKPQSSKFVRSFNENKEQMEWLTNNIGELQLGEKNFQNCIDEAPISVRLPILAGDAYLNNSYLETKRQQSSILSCINRSLPSLIVQTDYAFKKAWNELRLRNFKERQMNWSIFLSRYAEVYGVSERIYNFFLHIKLTEIAIKSQPDNPKYEEKLKEFYDNIAKALSKENIRINVDQLSYGNVSMESRPKYIRGINVEHLADYILYHMACGQSIEGINYSTKGQGPNEDKLENISNIGIIRTPFGSSLEFIPPRITNRDPGICKDKGTRHFRRTKEYQEHKEITKNGDDVHVGGWYSQLNSKEYPNLYSYILDNMQLDFFLSDIGSDEFTWWNENVAAPTSKVWKEYEGAYKRLVKTELLPHLFEYEHKMDEDENPSWIEQGRSRVHKLTKSISFPKTGIIDQSYQDLEEYSTLLLNLARKRNILTPQMEEDIQERLQIFSAEMESHKNDLNNWSNNENLYSSEEESALLRKVFSLSESINREIKGVTKIGGYTLENIIYMYSQLGCEGTFQISAHSFLETEGNNTHSSKPLLSTLRDKYNHPFFPPLLLEYIKSLKIERKNNTSLVLE